MLLSGPDATRACSSFVPQVQATDSIPAALDAWTSIALSPNETTCWAVSPRSCNALNIGSGAGLIGLAS